MSFPILGWNKLGTPRYVASQHVLEDFKAFNISAIFVIMFLCMVVPCKWVSNEVNISMMISHIPPTIVVVTWLVEKGSLILLVICFVTLGSSTFNSSYGTSTMDISFWCTFMLTFDFGIQFFFNVLYCNEGFLNNVLKFSTFTPKHRYAHHWWEKI